MAKQQCYKWNDDAYGGVVHQVGANDLPNSMLGGRDSGHCHRMEIGFTVGDNEISDAHYLALPGYHTHSIEFPNGYIRYITNDAGELLEVEATGVRVPPVTPPRTE